MHGIRVADKLSSVMGRPQCKRGVPGLIGKCQKNVQMPILDPSENVENDRKMSNGHFGVSKMGPPGTTRKMSKKCQNVILEESQMGSPKNVQIWKKMTKSIGKCRNRIEHVQIWTFSVQFRYFPTDFDIFFKFGHFPGTPFGTPPKWLFDIFF